MTFLPCAVPKFLLVRVAAVLIRHLPSLLNILLPQCLTLNPLDFDDLDSPVCQVDSQQKLVNNNMMGYRAGRRNDLPAHLSRLLKKQSRTKSNSSRPPTSNSCTGVSCGSHVRGGRSQSAGWTAEASSRALTLEARVSSCSSSDSSAW